jgi:hypothetical protein
MCIGHSTEEYRRFPIPRKPPTPPSHQEKSKTDPEKSKKSRMRLAVKQEGQDVTQGRRGAAVKPYSAIGQFDSVVQVG